MSRLLNINSADESAINLPEPARAATYLAQSPSLSLANLLTRSNLFTNWPSKSGRIQLTRYSSARWPKSINFVGWSFFSQKKAKNAPSYASHQPSGLGISRPISPPILVSLQFVSHSLVPLARRHQARAPRASRQSGRSCRGRSSARVLACLRRRAHANKMIGPPRAISAGHRLARLCLPRAWLNFCLSSKLETQPSFHWRASGLGRPNESIAKDVQNTKHWLLRKSIRAQRRVTSFSSARFWQPSRAREVCPFHGELVCFCKQLA